MSPLPDPLKEKPYRRTSIASDWGTLVTTGWCHFHSIVPLRNRLTQSGLLGKIDQYRFTCAHQIGDVDLCGPRHAMRGLEPIGPAEDAGRHGPRPFHNRYPRL